MAILQIGDDLAPLLKPRRGTTITGSAVCARRLLARSGAAALLACAVAAAFSPAALGAGGFQRDKTLLPAQLRNPSTPAAAHSASASGTLARTIVGLAIVLAVVFGVYWLLKIFARGKNKAGKGDGRMDIVATTPLAPNRSLHLIRVGDSLILVGSAEGGISTIRTYSLEESDALQEQIDAQSDPLWPVAVGETVGPRDVKRSFMAELRRRTARK
jgi:flagellar protein FliO/FliZ